MDSKISQLPTATKVYDGDLLVAVTGYDQVGSYPDNVKISLDRIRYDIIRLDEMIYLLSGFSGYYNSGNNTMTITSHQYPGNLIRLDYADVYPYIQILSTTGLNAVAGNHIELQFISGTPAANKYGAVGDPYYTGVLSTTGINARGGNRIEIDTETNWPYSGIVSTTGLNANLNKGLSYTIGDSWPHEYTIAAIDRAKIGSNVSVYNTGSGFYSLTSNIQPVATISFDDLYGSRNYTSVKLLVTAIFKVNNIIFDNAPYVPGYGSTNDRKDQELASLNNYSHYYQYYACPNPPNPEYTNNTKIFTSGDFPDFADGYTEYLLNTFDLVVGISGGGTNNMINTIHTYPITFRNSNSATSSSDTIFYDPHRSPGVHTFNSIDPIIIQEPVTVYLNSSNLVSDINSLSLVATISNVRYRRIYTYILGTEDVCSNTSNIIFSYNAYGYASTNATVSCKILKAEYIFD